MYDALNVSTIKHLIGILRNFTLQLQSWKTHLTQILMVETIFDVLGKK